MRSFAAIATFAALAFSAITSALPTGATGGQAIDNLGGLANTNVLLHDLNLNVDKSLNPQINAVNVAGTQSNKGSDDDDHEHGDEHYPRGGDYKGIPDVLVDVNAQVGALIKDLTAKITAEVDVKVVLDLAVEVLGKVKVILEGAVTEINVILGGDLGVALCLKGVVVEISVVVDLIATLLKTILLVVALVLKICASIDVQVLLNLVVEISAVLAVILGLVAKVVVNLTVLLGPLVQIIAKICLDLKLTALISILHL